MRRTTFLGLTSLFLASAACGGTALSSHDAGDGGNPDSSPDARDSAPDVSPDAPPDAGDAAPEAEGGGCRSNDNCGPVSYCAGPYDGPCMGVCIQQKGCKTDTDCAGDGGSDGGTVCRDGRGIPSCGGDQGGPYCLPPCTSDDQCPPTDKCTADGHCAPLSCGECPAFFDCSTGTCTIPSCKTDSDCPTGFCVNGSCAGSLGTCMGECA